MVGFRVAPAFRWYGGWGFSALSAFSRCFRGQFGCSVSAWRAANARVVGGDSSQVTLLPRTDNDKRATSDRKSLSSEMTEFLSFFASFARGDPHATFEELRARWLWDVRYRFRYA